MSSITISGIVSGLDTTSIIDKLVAVEGNSKTLLANRQNEQKSAASAYGSLVSSVKTLTSQVAKLSDTSNWNTTTATSSSTSVAVTATGKSAASLSFDVTKLAAAHRLISNETVSSTGAVVASGGSLTLTDSTGTESSIDVGSGTLAEVVSAINGGDYGLRATAVQTSPGEYRLQVAAKKTGESSSFSLDGLDGFTAMNELTTGSDAEITVGSGAFAYTVSSTSNTFADVAEGMSFTVSKLETGVEVSTDVDPKAVSDQISAIVTGANNLLASISSQTAWDSSTKSGGPLLGSSSARSLQQGILSVVAGAGAPGLSVTSGGQLTFDAAAFKSAFAADPAAVMAAFGADSTFEANGTSGAKVVNSTSSTAAGSYDVQVTSPAKAEQWTLVPPGTGIVGRLMSITRGDTTVNYEITASDDMASAAANFTAKLAEAGMGVTVTADEFDNFVLTANSAGAAGAFTPNMDGDAAAQQLVEGADIAGTIDGFEASGLGNTLSLPPDTESGAAGLSIEVSTTEDDLISTDGSIGTLTYTPGVAKQLQSLFEGMTATGDGQLTQAQDAANEQVTGLQKQIDNWTTRLDAKRLALQRQFTAMETTLATLKSQTSALSSLGTSSSSSG